MSKLNQIVRIYKTVKYLKPIQIYFQVWYRLKNVFLSIHWYKSYLNCTLYPLTSKVDTLLFNKCKEYEKSNQFSFIGIKYVFEKNIDWNFLGNGKLWNYNLQYFNFLLDETIEVEERVKLIDDFSNRLLSENIKLEPYPVSLRIINTILFFSRNNLQINQVEESLLKQIDYLSHNLEKHIMANHLLENIISLYIASFSLKNVPLHSKAARLLITQLNEQILADGAHYERSPMYHSIILGKILLCIDIAESNQETDKILINKLRAKASKMLGWMNTYAFPDGSWALMNDAAENIAPTTQQLNDAAEILNIRWGKSTFSSSGFRKLTGSNWEMIANVGNITPFYQPGHAHADMLHFCIWHNGNQVVLDPGTSTYNISTQRSWERSTRAHNTITVNNANQSDTWGGFRVGKRATCSLISADSACIEACHDGFKDFGVIHVRRFEIINDTLCITDKISNQSLVKNIDVKSNLLLNAMFDFQLVGNEVIVDQVKISLDTPIQLNPAQFARSFNNLNHTKSITYSVSEPVRLVFKF